jgi:hypothetical protein
LAVRRSTTVLGVGAIERLFYHREMANMTDAWIEASASLPGGWQMAGVACDEGRSWRARAHPGQFA